MQPSLATPHQRFLQADKSPRWDVTPLIITVLFIIKSAGFWAYIPIALKQMQAYPKQTV